MDFGVVTYLLENIARSIFPSQPAGIQYYFVCTDW